MSSILKALKKLEEEQAGRSVSATPGSGVQFVAPARAGWRPLLLLVAGIGAGLLLAGGLYVLLGDRSAGPPSTAVVSSVQKSPGLSGTMVPASDPAVVKPAPAGPHTIAPPDKAENPTVPQEALKRPVVTEPVKTVQTDVVIPTSVSDKINTDSRPGNVEQVQVEHREIPAPGQQWAASHLTVSDILPNTGGGRMAIVNDLPVMEGTMVEDAVVKEIHPDRVLFVIDGKSVVVPLTPR